MASEPLVYRPAKTVYPAVQTSLDSITDLADFVAGPWMFQPSETTGTLNNDPDLLPPASFYIDLQPAGGSFTLVLAPSSGGSSTGSSSTGSIWTISSYSPPTTSATISGTVKESNDPNGKDAVHSFTMTFNIDHTDDEVVKTLSCSIQLSEDESSEAEYSGANWVTSSGTDSGTWTATEG